MKVTVQGTFKPGMVNLMQLRWRQVEMTDPTEGIFNFHGPGKWFSGEVKEQTTAQKMP